ncbi:MAG: hypothetical protein AMXMBFR13_43560, partial [Phycisphaerae bacterium]
AGKAGRHPLAVAAASAPHR